MKHSPLAGTATLADRSLLKKLVERLASRYYAPGVRGIVTPNAMAIETSSIEAFASGDINLSSNREFINLPFITGLLFTCIKTKDTGYDLTWSSSLS